MQCIGGIYSRLRFNGGDKMTDSIAQPSLEDLMAMEAEGYSIATDGCKVEPDGVCQHGCNSWLIELGMI